MPINVSTRRHPRRPDGASPAGGPNGARGWMTGLGRAFLVGALVVLTPLGAEAVADPSPNYGAAVDQGIAVPAVPRNRIPSRFGRQTVRYVTTHEPGTIVVDPANHFLYLVQPKGRALRYGVSLGKGAFAWSGQAVVAQKQSWPRWTPPAEMVQRSRNLSAYDKGLEGGLFNPMGARALYLFQGRRDTLYRIHGTSEWWSIGQDASSGCIRLLNQDVIDLAARAKVGTKVVVLKP